MAYIGEQVWSADDWALSCEGSWAGNKMLRLLMSFDAVVFKTVDAKKKKINFVCVKGSQGLKAVNTFLLAIID